MSKAVRPLPWLEPGALFPCVDTAWAEGDPAPGLLAAGSALDVTTLLQAYAQGIFPWFSEGQPILWWTPDPRMVLEVHNFRLHKSLRKTLLNFAADARCQIRFDSTFAEVIKACAAKPREGQAGTWILPEMVTAYCTLFQAGHAHSVETWIDGVLAGGLYCVNIGGAVFGESMFAHQTNASKIALAALVAFCRANNISMIDCQQNTPHLASLGATEMSRREFARQVARNVLNPAPDWHFETVYWRHILTAGTPQLPGQPPQ